MTTEVGYVCVVVEAELVFIIYFMWGVCLIVSTPGLCSAQGGLRERASDPLELGLLTALTALRCGLNLQLKLVSSCHQSCLSPSGAGIAGIKHHT